MDEDASPAVFDKSHLMAMTGGDRDLALEIIDIFREQAAVWARMLDPGSPPTQWANAAHSIKGAAAGAGALRLAETCGRAETLGRSDRAVERVEAAVALSDVKDELAQALEALAIASHDIAGSVSSSASKDLNS